MRRLEKQPGGLTDAQFALDPRQSNRSRNWFQVDWNILRLGMQYKPSGLWQFNASSFLLSASREALGYLGSPARIDFGDERDLIRAEFSSQGFDAKATRLWEGAKCDYNAVVFGIQGFSGTTEMYQGLASSGFDADFNYINPNNLEGSHYTLPNYQLAAFTQASICISEDISITPGLRYEWIDTRANGWFRETIEDGAGNILEDSIFTETRSRVRGVLLPGIGFSLKRPENAEIYGNAVSNYRAINFSDMQIRNLGVVVDSQIQMNEVQTSILATGNQHQASASTSAPSFFCIATGLVSKPLQFPTPYSSRSPFFSAQTLMMHTPLELKVWHRKKSGKTTYTALM